MYNYYYTPFLNSIHEESESDVIGSLHELCTIHYSASLTEITIIIMMKTIGSKHTKPSEYNVCCI